MSQANAASPAWSGAHSSRLTHGLRHYHPGVPTNWLFTVKPHLSFGEFCNEAKGLPFAATALIAGSLLLVCPLTANAQRHGGASAGGGGISAITRPSGVKEEDTLKDFHQAMAVQATSQQTAEFQALVKSTAAAQAELQIFLQQAQKGSVDQPIARQWKIFGSCTNAPGNLKQDFRRHKSPGSRRSPSGC